MWSPIINRSKFYDIYQYWGIFCLARIRSLFVYNVDPSINFTIYTYIIAFSALRVFVCDVDPDQKFNTNIIVFSCPVRICRWCGSPINDRKFTMYTNINVFSCPVRICMWISNKRSIIYDVYKYKRIILPCAYLYVPPDYLRVYDELRSMAADHPIFYFFTINFRQLTDFPIFVSKIRVVVKVIRKFPSIWWYCP